VSGSATVTLPVWALGLVVTGAVGLFALFTAALLILIQTLVQVTRCAREVERCASAVIVCVDVALVPACSQVEVLAGDIRKDWQATRAGVQSSITEPLERTLVSLKSAADPAAAAEMVDKARNTFFASLATLAAAMATMLAVF
jgi:hypothetical protein